MIIQANHLNYNYMQKLQAQQRTGHAFGQGTAQKQTGPAMAPRIARTPDAGAPDKSEIQDRVDVFGDLMGRYLNGFTDEKGETKDSTSLVSSLENTVRWIEERYGKDAATASMGMIVQSASNGQSEEGIGNGLLNVLKMVDRNFGIAAGDEAIAKFNSGINEELNGFFENGANEVFFASTSAPAGETAGISSQFFVEAQKAEEESEESVDPTKELLDMLLEDIEQQGGIESTKEALDEQARQTGMQQALAAYTSVPAPEAQLMSAIA